MPLADPKRLISCRQVRPWLVSLAAHSMLLIVLAMWALPRIASPGLVLRVDASGGLSQQLDRLSLVLTPPAAETEPAASETDASDRQRVLQKLHRPSRLVVARLSPKPSASVALAESIQSPDSSSRPDTAPIRRSPNDVDSLRRAMGIAGAMDGITDAIRDELGRGDCLVAWLFDASTSLREHRRRMTDRASRFFYELETERRQRPAARGVLSGTVVAYGRHSRVVQRPTTDSVLVSAAMRRLPVDTTGLENVMTAVDRTVRHLTSISSKGQRLVVVILTDESGSDVERLEDTIEVCVRHGVAVHVLGPTSTFGLPLTNQVIGGVRIASVSKGPESAMPERFHAGFWFEDEPSHDRHAIPAFPWHGGRYRECLPTGLGVYSLTRLALQTSGTYTMFDSEPVDPDRGQYDIELMRQYAPTYQSLAQYGRSVDQSSLRSFVVRAATLSQSSGLFEPPPRQLPVAAVTKMGGQVVRQIEARLKRARSTLIQWVGQPGGGQQENDGYGNEESPRWRATYDLTRGRVLAWLVRIDEYLAANETLRDPAKRRGSRIEWQASPRFRLPTSQAVADAAQRHLRRCVEQHPGTPWATLAAWELATPMGTTLSYP